MEFCRKIFRWVKTNIFRHPWWTPNRKSRKHLREEANKLIGYDKRVNQSWKKSWKYFISRQVPWYGLLEITQYKIIEMRDYMQHHSIINESDTQVQIAQMTKIIDLGYKILADEYSNEIMQWNRENQVGIIYLYPTKHNEENTKYENLFSTLEQEPIAKLYYKGMFSDILPEPEESSARKLEFLKDKCTLTVDEWLAEQNKVIDEMNINLDKEHKLKHMTSKDITTTYSSEYINGKSAEENSKYFREENEKAFNQRKKDIKRYYSLISKYVDFWGD